MSWAEVSKVNGDFLNAPLDVKMHLADYKMHGKKSYVFQIKDLLHGIYECTYISMNDQDINGEALEYLIKNNKHIGEAFIAVFDLERKDTFKTLRAMTAVLNSSTAMTAVLNSSTAMTAVLNSSTAMTAVANSSTAMTAVANSSTAMTSIGKSSYNTTKAVIKAINNNEDYIKKVFDTVTSDNSKFQLVVNQNQDGVSNLNQFCNTPNTIILCALGAYVAGGSTSVLINNELIRSSGSAGLRPSYVDRNNCSAIAVPNATFTEYADGHAAISVYKVI